MEKLQTEFLELFDEYKNLEIASTINYEKFHEILISYHSTSIEGSSLTYEEARLLLNDGLTAKGKPMKDADMVRDHQSALEFVIATANEQKLITPTLIREIASKVMKNTGSVHSCMDGNFDSSKGEYRLLSVRAGDTYFMPHQKVPMAVDGLCHHLNARNIKSMNIVSAYDLAFDAHIGLVSVHPFVDGNGRTSRLLMNYILAYHKLPLAVCYTEDKLEYYNVLHSVQQNEDKNTTPFRNFMYSQQIKFLKSEILAFKKSQQIDETNPCF